MLLSTSRSPFPSDEMLVTNGPAVEEQLVSAATAAAAIIPATAFFVVFFIGCFCCWNGGANPGEQIMNSHLHDDPFRAAIVDPTQRVVQQIIAQLMACSVGASGGKVASSRSGDGPTFNFPGGDEVAMP